MQDTPSAEFQRQLDIIAGNVRDVLIAAVFTADEHREFDEFDHAALNLAAAACAFLIFCDVGMKHCGALSTEGAENYVQAVIVKNACLRALKIADPYEARAN